MKIPSSIVKLLYTATKIPAYRYTVAAILCGISASLTFAQDATGAPTAPLPGTAPPAKGWVWYLLAGMLFALVTAVSIRQGKRTHQD